MGNFCYFGLRSKPGTFPPASLGTRAQPAVDKVLMGQQDDIQDIVTAHRLPQAA